MVLGQVNFERWLNPLLVLLIVPYAGIGLTYDAVELQGPFLFLFLPICIVSGLLAAAVCMMKKLSLLKSIGAGIRLGFVASLILFLSNFTLGERFEGTYFVRDVTQGRGSSVNWHVETAERKDILLNVHISGTNASLIPGSVQLVLYRGWLGYFYGKRT